MDKCLVDKKTHVVYGIHDIFAMIPCMNPRTGKGLARYIQSLHQYQRHQEQENKLNGSMPIAEGERFLNIIGDEIPRKHNDEFIKRRLKEASLQHIQHQPLLQPKSQHLDRTVHLLPYTC
jgi:hypothetical protein